MAVLNNTSGHLQPLPLKLPQAMKAVHAMVQGSVFHHSLEMTISVSQVSAQVPLGVFMQMIHSGMVKAVLAAVNVAHSTVLHALSKNSLPLLLMPLKHKYAYWLGLKLLQLSLLNYNVKYDQHDSITARLDRIESKQGKMNQKVATGSELQHFTKELKRASENILEYIPHAYECGGTRGWRCVVYLNMSDITKDCPSGWSITSYYKRTCGRVSNSELSCDSTFSPVSGGHYTTVCESIRAYQHGHTDAFEAYDDGRATTINGAYVAGVSLTHGTPRQHICS